jgi:hypothetical protein
VLASVLFISLAQYANISTSSPPEISHLIENRCGNETSGMERLFAKRKRTLIDIAIKRWAFSIKWEREVISFKWEGLFHSSEEIYFIQMGTVISFKWGGGLFHSNRKGYSIQMRRVIQFKWREGYFIQIESVNDYIQIILLSKLLSFAKKCMINRFNIIVQEDKTLSHAFKHHECRCASSFVIEQFIWFEYDRTMLTLNEKTDYACRCFEISSCSRQSMISNVDIKSYLNDFFEMQIFDEVI